MATLTKNAPARAPHPAHRPLNNAPPAQTAPSRAPVGVPAGSPIPAATGAPPARQTAPKAPPKPKPAPAPARAPVQEILPPEHDDQGGYSAEYEAPQQYQYQDDPAPARNTAVARPREDAPVPSVVADSVPDWMRQDAGAGMENIGREDLEINRIKLIQGTSKELQVYDSLRVGQFFHSGAEEAFSDLEVVPIYVDKRYMLWRPLEDGGGVLARSDDGIHWQPANRTFEVTLDKKHGGHKVTWTTANTVEESGLAEWGSMNPDDPDSQPAAVLMYCFVVVFPDRPDLMPAVITFQRASVKAGKKWLTRLKQTRAPLFGQRFRISSVIESNGSNQDFYNYQITGSGFVADKAEYARYKEMHDQFSALGVQIKDVDEVAEESAPVDDGGASPEGTPNY